MKAGQEFLAEHGLNLLAVLKVSLLPGELQRSLRERCGEAPEARVLVVGNGGPWFWRSLEQNSSQVMDPVDSYTHRLVERCFVEHWGDCDRRWLYPSSTLFPVIPFGVHAGWHQPSPLGQGIHAIYGLWFAYRALLWVNAAWPEVKEDLLVSPCESCVEKPCLSACPAQALSVPHAFQVMDCFDYRWSQDSSCRDRCLARLACPLGATYRYDMTQIQYHAQHSLEMAKQSLKSS